MNVEETTPTYNSDGGSPPSNTGGSDTEGKPGMNNNTNTNNAADDERSEWTKPSDKNPKFPFCYQRREPFLWFNRVLCVVLLGVFIFMAYQIIGDYMAQQTNPPTASNYVYGSDQDFPGMAFCMHKTSKAYQPGLVPLFALYQDGSSEDGGVDITSSLKHIDCSSIETSPSSSVASSSSPVDYNGISVGKDNKGYLCWYMDETFPAFNTSKAYAEESCAHKNHITMGFYFNVSEYDPTVMNIGIDGYFFPTTRTQHMIDRICKGQRNPLVRDCSNSMMKIDSVKEAETCREALNVDTFYATNRLSNMISLERSEGASPQCPAEDTRVHWNPQTTISNHNPQYQIPFNDNNITLGDGTTALESTILMEFSFRSGDKIINTYNIQSFGTFFGSLGGWWGCLSDGWGLLSVVFMVEEFINWVIATNSK